MKKEFYSNGKLLITGEYVVLDGAKALALPTKFGQKLEINQGEDTSFNWKSFDFDSSLWFEDVISFSEILEKDNQSENKIRNTLIDILHEANLLNPEIIKNSSGFNVETKLTFPKFWGLGTSSTLINNIAQWFKIDAFTLLKNSFGGSGYDVACAQNDSAIIYQLINEQPNIDKITFNPEFSNKIYFVYLNKKQSSKTAIAAYLEKQGSITKTISKINNLTNIVATTNEPKEFAKALQQHEIELSTVLEQQTIQEALFYDFDGVVKSLGAWGGDFVLALSKENPTDYFKERGFTTVISYSDMIK